jgi:hypothetical protein
MTLIVIVNENRYHQIRVDGRRSGALNGWMKSLLAAAILGAAALPAGAQHSLEIIPLRHRTVEQVLPVLQPLLEPGATLTGQRNQLIVRTSPENLADLRRALAAIDRPARRLLISVRFDDAGNSASRELGASGRISNRGTRIEVQARDGRSGSAERVDQRIQVLEGGRAFIMAGQSMPVPGGIWQTATGFEAVPRLAGDLVTVDISPQKESFERQQRMSTTVSARLGEWFEVGGAASSATRDDRGIASSRSAGAAETRRVWLKVEELP